MSYVILAFLWIFFCVVHSLLLIPAIVDFLTKKLSFLQKYYRISFNIVSIITIFPALIYSYHMPVENIFMWPGNLIYIKYLLLGCGVLLFLFSIPVYNWLTFIGIPKSNNTASDDEFVDTGLLGLIRHPLYTAFLIIIWGRNITIAVLVTNVIFIIYIFIGTWLEERKLCIEFQGTYKEYQNRVSPFIPVKWIIRKFGEL